MPCPCDNFLQSLGHKVPDQSPTTRPPLVLLPDYVIIGSGFGLLNFRDMNFLKI